MICPNCQKTVDPLRAPAAKIVGGKVMTFCSPECARGEKPAEVSEAVADAAPVPTPAPRVESAPVPAPVPRIESAPVARVDATPVAEPRKSRRGIFLAIGILVAAGIGGAIVERVGPGHSAPAAAS